VQFFYIIQNNVKDQLRSAWWDCSVL